MKTFLVTLAALALVLPLGMTAEAQTVDFSGTWTLDADASQLPQGRDGGGGGGGGGRGRMMGGGAAATVVIAKDGDQLVMEQTGGDGQSRTLTYRLDGSESTNTAGRGELVTTTEWDGAALVTEGVQEMSTPRGDMTIELIERRTLSDDGGTMTVESTRTTPRGDISMTLVYRKSTT